MVKPGGTGSSQHRRHLGQVGALAAEEVLHLHRGLAVGVVEVEDVRHRGGSPEWNRRGFVTGSSRWRGPSRVPGSGPGPEPGSGQHPAGRSGRRRQPPLGWARRPGPPSVLKGGDDPPRQDGTGDRRRRGARSGVRGQCPARRGQRRARGPDGGDPGGHRGRARPERRAGGRPGHRHHRRRLVRRPGRRWPRSGSARSTPSSRWRPSRTSGVGSTTSSSRTGARPSRPTCSAPST